MQNTFVNTTWCGTNPKGVFSHGASTKLSTWKTLAKRDGLLGGQFCAILLSSQSTTYVLGHMSLPPIHELQTPLATMHTPRFSEQRQQKQGKQEVSQTAITCESVFRTVLDNAKLKHPCTLIFRMSSMCVVPQSVLTFAHRSNFLRDSVALQQP